MLLTFQVGGITPIHEATKVATFAIHLALRAILGHVNRRDEAGWRDVMQALVYTVTLVQSFCRHATFHPRVGRIVGGIHCALCALYHCACAGNNAVEEELRFASLRSRLASALAVR
jgi:hypothetical protein